jgi:dihydroneopterin triphosphate diphosphatase
VKIPESVLVVIYTTARDVLLLERSDSPGYCQSVTGSRASLDEPLVLTCAREVAEETGLVREPKDFDDWRITHRYAIYLHWRKRYAPGVTHNTEYVFGLRVPERFEVTLAPDEHTRSLWLPWRDAAEQCFSWTNAQAIRLVGQIDLPAPT